MTKLRKILYTTRTHSAGGRDDGSSRTDDGLLEVTLSTPGGPGSGNNPEQLFPAGWSAYFLSATKIVAGKKKIAPPADVLIDAEVDLGLAHGIHARAARLNVHLSGLDQRIAEEIVEAAHHVYPYSNATQGNIEVTTNVITDVTQTARSASAAQHV